MARSVSRIRKDILALGSDHKEALLRDLILDPDKSFDDDVERVWLEASHRRLKELNNGSVEPIPVEEVFKRVRARLAE